MLNKFVFHLIRATLLPFLVREIFQRKRVTIVVYHAIDPATADLHFKLLKSKYNIISLKDYVSAKRSGAIDNLPAKSLIITFDDGDRSNHQLIPLFEKYNIAPTVFLCGGIADTNRHFWWKNVGDDSKRQYLKKVSDENRLEILAKCGFEEKREFDDRQALSKDEIEEMKRIVDFQSHTLSHPILPKCSDKKAIEEITQGGKILERNFGLDIYAIAFPNGDYSDREIAIAKKASYECALTLDLGFNSQDTDLFRLRRICISDDAHVSELLVKASGLWDYMKNYLKGGNRINLFC